jgi:hypothetical protein
MPYVAAHVQGNVGTSDALYTAVVGVVSLWVLASTAVAAAFPVERSTFGRAELRTRLIECRVSDRMPRAAGTCAT